MLAVKRQPMSASMVQPLAEQMERARMTCAGPIVMRKPSVDNMLKTQAKSVLSTSAAVSCDLIFRFDWTYVLVIGKHGFCGVKTDFCGDGCQSNCEQPGSGASGGDVQQRIIGYYEAWKHDQACAGMVSFSTKKKSWICRRTTAASRFQAKEAYKLT